MGSVSDALIGESRFSRIEHLLNTSYLSEREQQQIRAEMGGYDEWQRERCIAYLLEQQTCPIAAGKNYNQTDIKNKIKREIL